MVIQFPLPNILSTDNLIQFENAVNDSVLTNGWSKKWFIDFE